MVRCYRYAACQIAAGDHARTTFFSLALICERSSFEITYIRRSTTAPRTETNTTLTSTILIVSYNKFTDGHLQKADVQNE